MGIQILVTLISAYIVYRAFQSCRKKNVSFSMAFVWSLFWIAMIILVWQPALSDRIASILRVGRGADAIFYLALIFIFYLLFKLFIRIEQLDVEVTTLIREIAILEKERKE